MAAKTRKEVAEMFGISVGTLYRWERDGKTPKPTKIRHNQELRYSDEVIAAIQKFVNEEVPSHPIPPASSNAISSAAA